jgi:hypothetical protein
MAAGGALRLAWQNEAGGLTFEVTGGTARVFVKWQPAGTSIAARHTSAWCCRSVTATTSSRPRRGELSCMSTNAPNEPQHEALAAIFLGKAGGTVANPYGPVIGEVYAVRGARISLEHGAARKRVEVVGYLRVGARMRLLKPTT